MNNLFSFHLQVTNYSYECFHPGQEIAVRVKSGGWLHRGAIRCPPCHEVCGNEFAQRNETCKLSEEAPPSNIFHKDELFCSTANIHRITIPNQFLFTFVSIKILMKLI